MEKSYTCWVNRVTFWNSVTSRKRMLIDRLQYKRRDGEGKDICRRSHDGIRDRPGDLQPHCWKELFWHRSQSRAGLRRRKLKLCHLLTIKIDRIPTLRATRPSATGRDNLSKTTSQPHWHMRERSRRKTSQEEDNLGEKSREARGEIKVVKINAQSANGGIKRSASFGTKYQQQVRPPNAFLRPKTRDRPQQTPQTSKMSNWMNHGEPDHSPQSQAWDQRVLGFLLLLRKSGLVSRQPQMRWAKGASGIYRGAQAYVWVDVGPGPSGRSADDQTHRGTFLSSLMPKMAGFIDKNSQPEQ